MVLACSNTVEEYITLSGEAVRLAFWIGYRAAELSQDISRSSKARSWALSVFGKDKETVESDIHSFNGKISEQSQIRLASRFGKASFSIVGPGHALEAFRSQHVFAPCSAEEVPVHALYHGGDTGLNALGNVLEDVKKGNIIFPPLIALKRPIWSCNAACLVDASTLAATSPLEYILRLILVDTADLYTTWLSVVDTISSSDEDWEIVTVGPGSKALLASVCKDISRPARTIWTDVSGPFQRVPTDGFAIVGMSVNFPMGAGKDAFWRRLEHGLNEVQEIPGTRFQVEDYKSGKTNRGEMKASHGNFLRDPFQFDHEYFGISPREAKSMDPQQKLLLQSAVHAMDDAGYVANGAPSFNPETIGCYIGVATDDYVQNLAKEIDVYYSTGTLRAFLSGKISYAYGWSGPSIVIDTACSSSLVSVVMACRALAQGDCTTALAGGVNAITSPDMYLGLSRAHFLSPTGQCKPFDMSADGYCRGEGCGLFVIKRLSDAVREGDRIYGVIKDAHMNQSGQASSITHPHGPTQQQLFKKLLSRARIDAKSINAGDAVEASSIASVFGGSPNPVYITSIKGNIGHAEAASGCAGLAKLLMMLRFSKIPPQIGLKSLNPKLQILADRNIRIPTTNCEWNRISLNLPRRALLNNFGAAGSNAALIIEEYSRTSSHEDQRWPQRTAYNLVLSAGNSLALRELIGKYVELLHDGDVAIEDLCYTSTARRQRHPYVLSIVGGTVAELAVQLQRHKTLDVPLVNYQNKYPVVFVFSGQGSFYPAMGQQLMLTAPVFRAKVEECDQVLHQHGFDDILPSTVLDGSFSPTSAIDSILWSQVACFVLEYSLACLWMSWNIRPDVVIGHSLGEYTAMVISGALSLEDALLLVMRRAKLMASMCPIGETSMLACNLSASSVEHLIAESLLPQLTVACDNSASDSVVSGPVGQIDQIAQLIKEKGIRCKRLDVPLGFHSPALDAILPDVKTICEDLHFATPNIPLGSCLHGRLIEDGDLDPSYPVRQTRGKVRFTDLMNCISKRGDLGNATFIEVGPGPITLPMVRTKFATLDALFLPSIAKGQDAWASLSRSLQQMSLRYDSIQWRAVFDGTSAHVIDLPEYPFQMHSLYVPFVEPKLDLTMSTTTRNAKPDMFHLLGDVMSLGSAKGLSKFRTSLDVLSKFIEGHSVHGSPLCPASVYHEMVLEAVHCQAAPHADGLAVVSNVTFGNPLVYSPEKKSSQVLLTMEETSLDLPEAIGARFTFAPIMAPSLEPGKTLCSGQVEWRRASEVKGYLARKAAYAKRHMKVLQRNQSQRDVLHRNVIYNTIFPRVVTYSEPYQSIEELSVSAADLDGYGTFKVPESALTGGIVSPVFIDTLLHAAGFVANSQCKLTDAFICSEVESAVMQYTDITPQETFLIYCNLLECGNDQLIGEAFAMTLDGSAVASIEGMHFKRLNLTSFANHLSRQTGQQSAGKVSRPVLHRAETSTKINKLSVPSESDLMGTVVDLISKLCEQPREVISPDRRLADLGIDSLMQIELSHSLKCQFPHIEMDGLMESSTVQEIQDYIVKMRVESSGVCFAHDVSSKSSSDNSDDDSIMSGKLTPYTEVTNISDEATDSLMQLLAETCGFRLSDINQNMTLQSLGMDSLMAIEFQDSLQREFGATLTPDVLSPTLTIRELGVKLTGDVSRPVSKEHSIEHATAKSTSPESVEEQFVVQLQRGPESCPPLILFHDGSGLIKKYENLSTLGCNMFGVRNPEFSARPHWARSLRDMASRYAAAISSIVKAKQVVLGGWSFGGVLAHEVAQQLDTFGYTTLAVLLIDSPCPSDHQPLPEQVVNYILGPKRLPSPVLTTMSSQFKSHAQFLAGYSVQQPIPRTRKYVMLHSEQVLDTTRLCGVPYPWLESRQDRVLALRQWERILERSLVVYDIPGNHFEPFNDENVRAQLRANIRYGC
ncbi:beta-ketoacyl synthase [Aspergillus ambiguus]|uniref:beta-ketoacyl synthase n=1 Tax=Aspergillus ambiguus TaxID=176160 RepID=UPI003CCE3B1E